MPRAIDPVSGDRIVSEEEAREEAILMEHRRAEELDVEIRYERAAFLDEYPREYAA